MQQNSQIDFLILMLQNPLDCNDVFSNYSNIIIIIVIRISFGDTCQICWSGR